MMTTTPLSPAEHEDGTMEARFEWLLSELAKLFPGAEQPFSSEPEEPRERETREIALACVGGMTFASDVELGIVLNRIEDAIRAERANA